MDRLLQALSPLDLPRALVVQRVRQVLEEARQAITLGSNGGDADSLVPRLQQWMADLRLSRLGPVINGTGIIIHTNLGRSPLSERVVQQLAEAARHYDNLEFDLVRGERGKRGIYVEQALAALCESAAATVVNNCAAALVLLLRHLASKSPRQHVIISRGELVQIGGGFRIPDILQASGAILCEVGTTNKTSLADYVAAINDQTAMILRVHQSNFYMDGFVDSPPTGALAALAHEHGLPMVVDLGSGAMFDTQQIGADAEPTPAQVMRQGADAVTFSGDKLLGGPQAGIIAGSASLIAALKREPFFRALRCDKLILTCLQETVELHLSTDPRERQEQIPILAMMHRPLEELRARADRLVEGLSDLSLRLSIGSGESQVGGGTLPRTRLPSVTLDLLPASGDRIETLAERLRRGRPAIVGYIANGRLRLDLRTIFPEQDATLAQALRAAASA